ncbi:glycosyltransferase [Providencia rettgeri]|uniref:glycosyltransferase n=1 Tax=Providencia rettgeri TaxID=587 RepID=UPI0018E423FC|nr:glycosyltransferase [Providencia rettgeri]MBI6191593.1 glycosyltransferase [Providencia rettgeri]
MIKFSVLLSVYKNERAECLELSLNSIAIEQTKKPNEIVLVKDGPLTKKLETIIVDFKKSTEIPVKIISLKNNVGLGNALNEGLRHCSHDWVFRMDTDDISLPHRFEKQINFIINNPKIAILGAHIEEYDNDMTVSIGVRKTPCTHSKIIDYIKSRNPFNHMTVAFRKDVIESVGGYQHHLYMEDYNLWIRVIAAGHQVGNIDEILVNVRGGDSMVKRRKGLVYIKSELQLAKLKIEKNIDSPIGAYSNFTMRSIPRLLPTYMLSKVYKNLRK